ncbi:MAG: integrase domain-containing protein [Roseivirga sp.]
MTHKNVVRISEFVAPLVAPKSKRQRKNEIKFTDVIIRNLKSKERETFYCEGLDGFGIRVTPKGTKTWIYLYRIFGQSPQRYRIGRYPQISLAEARKEYGIAVEKVEKGIDPNREAYEAKKKSQDELIVDELIPLYIQYCKAKGEKAYKEKERALKRDASPTIGKMKMSDFTFREISPIVNTVFLERNSIEGARHLLSYLRTMFKYAKNGLGLIEINPCADLEAPKRKVKKDPRFLSPDEIYLFWNNIEKTTMTHVVKLGIKFMLCTLQRGVEVRTMQWSEVNMAERVWIIPAEKAKNGVRHLVPLNKHAITILEQVSEITGHSEYAFGFSPIWRMNPKAKKPNLKPMGNTAFNHASRENFHHYGIEKYFTPHALRKTGATSLTSVSFSRYIVKKLLNHKPSDVTAVYDLFDYFEEKRAGMEILNYVLDRILSAKSIDFVPSIKTLRKEVITKGLINDFMKEDHYIGNQNRDNKKIEMVLANPISYNMTSYTCN